LIVGRDGFLLFMGTDPPDQLVGVQATLSDSDLAGLVHFTSPAKLTLRDWRWTTGLAVLARLPRLEDLSLRFPLSDEAILHVSRATGLSRLEILNEPAADGSRPSISAAALRELGKLHKVQALSMTAVATSDEHLAFLAQLPQLRYLRIGNDNRVTDDSLRLLGDLRNLESLYIRSRDITNAGLKHLESLTRLKALELRNTRITAASFKELQRKLPDCKIYR
jgi:hypothetical protein